MAFINNLIFFSVLIFINFILSSKAEDCDAMSNFFLKKNLIMFNASESVVFLPTLFNYNKFREADWKLPTCVDSDNCYTKNEVSFNSKRLQSLLKTNLAISDEELSKAIYRSLVDNKLSSNVINVFPDRYIVRTNPRNTITFSTKFGVKYNIVKPNCVNFMVRNKESAISGLICKFMYTTGVRYNIKCNKIKLSLIPVDDDGNIQCETICTN